MTSSSSATATFEDVDPNDPKVLNCNDAEELNKYANHFFKVIKDIDRKVARNLSTHYFRK